ncbi:MAG: pyridoxal phosphate-dependent aminotransferase [Aquificaceae bacterium]
MLSKRLQGLSQSATLSLNAKISELRALGKDIIAFAAGEPDIDTPDFIKQACIKALKEGKTKYTPSGGIFPLREILSESINARKRADYSPSSITITSGAKMALFLVFSAILDEGDEVLIPSPYWVTYPEQVKLLGGVPVFVDLPEDRGFELIPELFIERITTRTKAVVINSPCNPTGAVYTKSSIEKLAEICLSKGIYIISDECYEELTFDGILAFSPISISKEVREITFLVSAFSKSFSMTGWRVGYVASPERFSKAIENLNGQTISNATSFAQYAAYEALKNPLSMEFLKYLRDTFQKRRDISFSELSKLGLSVNKPSGAFYILANFRNYLSSLGEEELLNVFLDFGVACVPGSPFGAKGLFRLSFCLSEENIKEGIRRISLAIDSLSR